MIPVAHLDLWVLGVGVGGEGGAVSKKSFAVLWAGVWIRHWILCLERTSIVPVSPPLPLTRIPCLLNHRQEGFAMCT